MLKAARQPNKVSMTEQDAIKAGYKAAKNEK